MPLKSALITTITAAAFFLSGFHFSLKPSVAGPIPPPPTVESATKESDLAEEKEALDEEQLHSNSNDID
ncbi:hypothetical protein PHJA_002356600 [Phtheirospermum japonicum]|uniref:Uncharacterized protein n=1 Tax=Phtheirospermum japonicum TaxID=374723 RepID=A0A830CSF9_9LAMI|nr:hypothetical protein PHJA_002356600 [Phtheirospermum japonicum]